MFFSYIKKTVFLVIQIIGRCVSFFYSPHLESVLNKIFCTFYTSRKNRFFLRFGENSLLMNNLILVGGKYVCVGKNTIIYNNAEITAWNRSGFSSPSIIVGDNCCIGSYVHISAVDNIYIGNNVLMGRWITITDNSHGTSDVDSLFQHPMSRPLCSKGAIYIGDDVWIGDKVTILPGVTIGRGAVVGANSVVTKNVPEYMVVAGSPARELCSRK